VSQYQKGKTNLDFTEARDSEWQWHQLGHMQVCTSLQTDNHASTLPHVTANSHLNRTLHTKNKWFGGGCNDGCEITGDPNELASDWIVSQHAWTEWILL